MLKKVLVLFLTLMMLAGIALADFASEYYIPPVIDEGQYPVATDRPVNLNYWMTINRSAVSWIKDNDENAAWKKAQEVTGVDYKFIHPAVGQERESYLTMIASGELPDLIQQSEGSYSGGLQKMYDDGLIIDLTPYLEKYAPQYLEVVSRDETAMRQITYDGKILGFHRLTYTDALPFNRANLRQDWLDEFDMESPLTIAEYEAYFDAILANKPGATPLYLNFENEDELMPFLSAFDMIKNFYVEEGVVKHFWNADQLREFIELMNDWYRKGYISKDFASLTTTEVMAMFDGGTLGMYVGSCDNCAIRTAGMDIKVTNARYLRKEDDAIVRTEITSYPVAGGEITVITTACKDVEAAVAALNYGYTKEGALTFTFGIEGEHWNYDPETGIPAFTEFMTKNPDGMTISNVSYVYKCHLTSRYSFPDVIGIPALVTDGERIDARSLWAGKNDPNVNAELRLPPFKLTAEESSERNDLLTELNAYGQEMLYKYITNAEPLDSFDAFTQEMMDLGLDRALEITQAAYDRFVTE